ncbi:MAG: ribokinase [Acidimicrobiia bacterium]|nr:ribokinase [Acidimicrobiia bacterium]
MTEIAVVGSLNIDTTIRVTRLPRPGETVLGTGHSGDTGGKGANQAVAAARLGRSTAMIGMVGDDDGGRRLAAVLADAGVTLTGLLRSEEHPTGVALITVDDTGGNTIVVSPGANGHVSPDDVDDAADLLGGASVTLAQLEIPIAAVTRAAILSSGRFVLNPAPAATLDPDLLARVDVLVPNETELAVLAGADEIPASIEDVASMARAVEGPGAVVVTLGARGAVVVEPGAVTHVEAPVVQAVDPTAAGDSFCAGLADALVRGKGLVEATRWAVLCGAVTVTRRGAQAALPLRADVERFGGGA